MAKNGTSNDLRGEVSILLDRQRRLKITRNAKRLFQREARISIDEMMITASTAAAAPRLTSNERYFAMGRILTDERQVILLWALLLKDDPTLSIEEVGDLMDQAPGKDDNEKDLYLHEKLFDAFNLSKGVDRNDPEVKKKEEELRRSIAEGDSRSAGETADAIGEQNSSSPEKSG